MFRKNLEKKIQRKNIVININSHGKKFSKKKHIKVNFLLKFFFDRNSFYCNKNLKSNFLSKQISIEKIFS